jgi:hypothetical protein
VGGGLGGRKETAWKTKAMVATGCQFSSSMLSTMLKLGGGTLHFKHQRAVTILQLSFVHVFSICLHLCMCFPQPEIQPLYMCL